MRRWNRIWLTATTSMLMLCFLCDLAWRFVDWLECQVGLVVIATEG